MDNVTPERRSQNMRRIRSTDTKPEVVVRRFLHSQGFRYRLHRSDLPGKPDLVFPAIRACLFVHGCFWHGCTKCVDGTRKVRSRPEYWGPKIARNRQRDAEHSRALRALGWRVLVIWDCEIATSTKLTRVTKVLFDLKDRRAPASSRRTGKCT